MTVDNPQDAQPQDALRSLFDAALAAADPALTVPPHLPAPPAGRTVVVGAGKASAAMARAVEDNWDGDLSGLVVTRTGCAVPCDRIEIVEAAHPVPDTAGLLLAIDPILDMGRTAVNVAGQVLVATLVAKREGLLDETAYQGEGVPVLS